MNLACIRHPKYEGKTTPTLDCRTCCSIFIAAIKAHNAASDNAQVDTYKWLEQKAAEGRAAHQAKTNKDAMDLLLRFGFNPFKP